MGAWLLSVYAARLGDRYWVRLLPVVLRELDDLKRAGAPTARGGQGGEPAAEGLARQRRRPHRCQRSPRISARSSSTSSPAPMACPTGCTSPFPTTGWWPSPSSC